MEYGLPCRIFCAVNGSCCALGVDIKDVLATEGIRVGVILVGAEPPIGGAGYGVYRDSAEETNLFTLNVNAVHKGIEIGRITERIGLDLECAFVGSVFVVIDGGAHLPQVAAEFALLFATDLKACDGNHHACKDGDDRYR